MPSVKKLAPNRYLVRGTDHLGRDRRLIAPTRQLADELALHLASLRVRHKHGLPVEAPRAVFADQWVEWLARFEHGAAGKSKPRPRTLETILEIRKRLHPLDNLWLDEISRERLEQLCAAIAAQGRQDRAHKTLTLAKRVLRDAADRGVKVDARVFEARIAPGRPREQQALSWEQVQAVASWMPEHVWRSVPFLALTGLRVGEFCALTDADVVLAKGGDAREESTHWRVAAERLCVKTGLAEEKAVTDGGRPQQGAVGEASIVLSGLSNNESRIQMFDKSTGPDHARPVTTSGEKRFGAFAGHSEMVTPAGASYILIRRDTTKTDAGARRVFLCAEAVRLVREQMLARPNVGPEKGSAQSRRALARGDDPGPRLLFPNQDGNPYNRHSYRQLLVRAATHAGIAGVHPHTLRATAMTLMAQAGVDAMIAKEQLGWSDATFARMLPIYRKVSGWEAPRAVRLLDALVAGQAKTEAEHG